MRIEIKKFGEILVSRPAGKEACAIMKSYLSPKDNSEKIELDFTGVKVMAPSWLDEVLMGLEESFPGRVICLPSSNASVVESLKFCGPAVRGLNK